MDTLDLHKEWTSWVKRKCGVSGDHQSFAIQVSTRGKAPREFLDEVQRRSAAEGGYVTIVDLRLRPFVSTNTIRHMWESTYVFSFLRAPVWRAKLAPGHCDSRDCRTSRPTPVLSR
jgi:hypothetical protein